MKYRAVWIEYKNGKSVIQKGELTTDLQTAKDDVEFKRALGFSAWVEDEESNRIG